MCNSIVVIVAHSPLSAKSIDYKTRQLASRHCDTVHGAYRLAEPIQFIPTRYCSTPVRSPRSIRCFSPGQSDLARARRIVAAGAASTGNICVVDIHRSPELSRLQTKLRQNIDYFDSQFPTEHAGNGLPIRKITVGQEAAAVFKGLVETPLISSATKTDEDYGKLRFGFTIHKLPNDRVTSTGRQRSARKSRVGLSYDNTSHPGQSSGPWRPRIEIGRASCRERV